MDVETAPLTSKGSPRFQIRYESSAPVAFENEDSSLRTTSRPNEWVIKAWKGEICCTLQQNFFKISWLILSSGVFKKLTSIFNLFSFIYQTQAILFVLLF